MKQKASILIVEDEQKIRSALRDFLEFQDFEVTEAADGLEAEQIVAEKQFDFIVSFCYGLAANKNDGNSGLYIGEPA